MLTVPPGSATINVTDNREQMQRTGVDKAGVMDNGTTSIGIHQQLMITEVY
jgi:hypothetical protein